jgi:hypothetical protein
MLSFEIYHPKNNVHNQDGNHDDNKVRITIFFFFELTDNDGQNFLAGIVLSSLSIYCPEQNSRIGRPVLLLEPLISSVYNHHSAFLKMHVILTLFLYLFHFLD